MMRDILVSLHSGGRSSVHHRGKTSHEQLVGTLTLKLNVLLLLPSRMKKKSSWKSRHLPEAPLSVIYNKQLVNMNCIEISFAIEN